MEKYKDILEQGILGFLALLSVGGAVFLASRPSPSVVAPEEQAAAVAAAQIPNPFAGVELTAAAAIVYDLRRGEALYEKNADAQLPLASLTKLMTALVASEALAPETAVAADAKTWSAADLISFTLLSSSNRGAEGLAAAASAALAPLAPSTPAEGPSEAPSSDTAAFIARMNATARLLGLAQTYFVNPTGLDRGAEPSNLGSARDAALLMAALVRSAPSLLEATRYPALSFTTLGQQVMSAQNTNTGLGRIPGLIGSKTGFTDRAGGNLAVALDAGLLHPLVIVVLGSTREGRFSDVETLIAPALACASNCSHAR